MYKLAILLLIVDHAFLAPTSEPSKFFDQRQNGEMNVHVNLKDLHVIALIGGSDSYTDYDYSYDYSEMTIKPQNSSTSTVPSVDSEANNSTLATQDCIIIQNNKNDSTLPLCEGNSIKNTSLEFANSTSEMLIISSSPIPPSSSSEISTRTEKVESTSQKNECRKGFHRNKNGECEVKPKNTAINTLKKLVELSQKLKLRHVD